ncbi:ERV1/ALR-related protein [Candidatus Saccharibacteria bacterium]|nr:ERV1/ALR-related protein [Candidatus Saccharibacteria bacterium]
MSYHIANDFWGPPVWISIHSFAMAYEPTPENAKAFAQFIDSLTNLLPCHKCRVHLRKNLAQLPLNKHLHSREALFRWTYQLHDLVNSQLKKPRPSYEWAEAYYKQKIYTT